MEKMNPKSAARLLAVQSYYSMLMDKKQTKENAINTALEILKSEDLKVKKSFAEELLNFCLNEKDSIEFIIKKYLDKENSLEGMNPVLQAIVSISLAELLSEKETDKPIIISEYLLITSNFFGRGETGFVNAILDRFVKENA